jgi:hypothetical protein
MRSRKEPQWVHLDLCIFDCPQHLHDEVLRSRGLAKALRDPRICKVDAIMSQMLALDAVYH